jgi:LmbE family N-acetylglucosaminyl deacetylase
MLTGLEFSYYDLRSEVRSSSIDLLFPNWESEGERLVILSPHDDDGILGAGYAILAGLLNGAEVHLIVFCDGWAGYSRPEEAESIVERRQRETVAAYGLMGIAEDHIHRLNYPDFSVWPWMGWHLPRGVVGTTARVLPAMRELNPTRLLVPNGYREHMDHESVFRVGAYDGPQVGDAILAEHGLARPIRSYLQYAVWGDFSPEDSLVAGAPVDLRANRAIVTSSQVEDRISSAVEEFESQRQVIAGILAARRKNRVRVSRAMELYLEFDPRPPLDYEPYHRLVNRIIRT